MSLISRPLTKGMLVVDSGEKLDRAKARALRAGKVDAVFRYVYYGEPRSEDLDGEELIDCTSEGLIVCVVQHPRLPENNTLSMETGKNDADWALTNALAAGYDPAVIGPLSLTCDMEGVRNPGPQSVAHANLWVDLVDTGVGASKFLAGVYIGYLCGLLGSDCDALGRTWAGDLDADGQKVLVSTVEFWCDAGPYDLRPKIARGYALKQGSPGIIGGVKIDNNTVLKDNAIFGAAAA